MREVRISVGTAPNLRRRRETIIVRRESMGIEDCMDGKEDNALQKLERVLKAIVQKETQTYTLRTDVLQLRFSVQNLDRIPALFSTLMSRRQVIIAGMSSFVPCRYVMRKTAPLFLPSKECSYLNIQHAIETITARSTKESRLSQRQTLHSSLIPTSRQPDTSHKHRNRLVPLLTS